MHTVWKRSLDKGMSKLKPVQYFSSEYLERCRAMSTDDIAQFLEDFRKMHESHNKPQLTSTLVPEALLRKFKNKRTGK